MGLPNISERLHYRLVPGEATEPTSTIVLTSKDSHYVDVRILKQKWAEEIGQEIKSFECIDWAFAGKCRTQKDSMGREGPGSHSHIVWDHWIDSNGDDAEPDEGDMTVQEDGTVLEEGVNVKADGREQKYEELWKDLPIDPLGKKQNRHSVVLRTEDLEQDIKGLVIKIGGWCQGIMRKGEELTIERWQLKPKHESATGRVSGNEIEEATRTRNDWVRTFKVGKETLACKDVCENTVGKLGMNVTKLYGAKDKKYEWRVIEEYYW